MADGGASTLVRQDLYRRPEMLRGKRLVVWEFVERDLRLGYRGLAKSAAGSAMIVDIHTHVFEPDSHFGPSLLADLELRRGSSGMGQCLRRTSRRYESRRRNYRICVAP